MPLQPYHIWFDVVRVGDVTVVRFTLEKIWKERTTEIIGEELLRLVEEGCRRLALNFASVESLGSMMLGKLNSLRNTLRAADGRLVLCRLNPVLAETFEITKLSRVFTICGEEQEALQALAAPGESGK